MTKVTWRNRKNTKTPAKAFDVSDVRRVTDVLLATAVGGAPSVRGNEAGTLKESVG